jgi:hypothetical protein
MAAVIGGKRSPRLEAAATVAETTLAMTEWSRACTQRCRDFSR